MDRAVAKASSEPEEVGSLCRVGSQLETFGTESHDMSRQNRKEKSLWVEDFHPEAL